jgi:hypothetical protein
MELAGTCDTHTPAQLISEAIPFAFQLTSGDERPTVHLTHTPDGRTWQA